MNLRPETWAELVSDLTRRLEAEGIDSARADVEQLAAGAADLDLSRVRLLCALGDPVPATVADRARRLAARRGTRVPLQHLLGEAPFGALRLAVGPGVLAPRPETELLAEAAIAAARACGQRGGPPGGGPGGGGGGGGAPAGGGGRGGGPGRPRGAGGGR
ncbi:MAG: hypothetical protein ABF811_00710, partial [Pseudoclavibacter sp.]